MLEVAKDKYILFWSTDNGGGKRCVLWAGAKANISFILEKELWFGGVILWKLLTYEGTSSSQKTSAKWQNRSWKHLASLRW